MPAGPRRQAPGNGDWLKEQKADAAVLAALDSIAWTFNVRGQDVDHTPVALSFALVQRRRHRRPVRRSREDRRRRPPASRQRRPRPRAQRFRADARPPRRQDRRGRSRAVGRGDLRGAGQGRRDDRPKRDPSILPKAIKNEVEIAATGRAGARRRRLSRFLHWLSIEAPKGGVDELRRGASCRPCARQAATCAT
jgi:Xaa-Pro aminopeptidase